MIETIHQQQVPQGGIIRAHKRWRNVGASGTRDIYALYGTGLTLETFLMEFGAVAVDQYCAAGAEVTTPVDCTVPVGASPGLRNALVGVAEYVYPTIIFDDYEIVPNAIEVVAAAPAMVTITITNKNAPTTWKYSYDLLADWNFVAYQGETTTVRNAVESIQAYLLEIGHYIGETYYEYGMDDIVEQGSAVVVNVSQACTWGMPPKIEAPYWVGLTNRSIGWCPFTPMSQDFNWTIYADELAAFFCYDATYHLIDTPNSGLFLGWGIFIDGRTYTWDFATGVLEGDFG